MDDIIKKAQQEPAISRPVIQAVLDNEDLSAGLRKAYKLHKDRIATLPFPVQFKICLDTVGFATEAIREYQEDQKEFGQRLKNEKF